LEQPNFKTLEDALGKLLSERRKSALLLAKLDNKHQFFQDQLTNLQHNLKKDTKYERVLTGLNLHQRRDCLLWKIQDLQNWRSWVSERNLTENNIEQPPVYRRRMASLCPEKYPA
jgi:hypothetical protein